MDKIIKDKIDFLKEKFIAKEYKLNNDDINDLVIQLERKPIQLYVLAIKLINKNKEKLNYENVKNLIKIDIRIRDNLKKIITSLEENIRNKYIDDKKIKFSNTSKIKDIYKEEFWKIIEELKIKKFHLIREIRNKINHITYPLIFEEFNQIYNKLLEIRKLKIINQKIFNKYLSSILNVNKNINLELVNNIFRNANENNNIKLPFK